MKSVCFVFLAAAICVAAAVPPDSKERPQRSPWNPFAGVGAFAGPGMAFAGAGAGGFMPFGFPFRMPTDYMPNFVPFPVIPFPTVRFPSPWYKGPNVCEDTKFYSEPEEIRQLMNDPSIGGNTDFQHDSESCRGNNEVYICSGKKMNNDVSKMFVTKYTCCHGFVRTYDGRPGCVEIGSGADVPPQGNPNQQYFGGSSRSSSSMSSSSGSSSQMDFVPLARFFEWPSRYSGLRNAVADHDVDDDDYY